VWRERHDRDKFGRALALAESLPAARGQVTRALRQNDNVRTRTLAAAFRMLDTGSLRIGSERYAETNGSHGLSTLLCAHVKVRKNTVTLCFPAKSGQLWESDIDDPDLAQFVRSRLRCQWPIRTARWRPVEMPTVGQGNCPLMANRSAHLGFGGVGHAWSNVV